MAYDLHSYTDDVLIEDLENSLEDLKQRSIEDNNHKQYLRALLQLARYHMDYDHRDKARKYVKMCIALCLPTSVDPRNAVVIVLPDVNDRYEVSEIAYQQWKAEGSVPSGKDKIRINYSVERNRLLASIVRVLETILEEIRPALAPIIEVETTKNPAEIDWRTPPPQPGDTPIVVEAVPVDPLVDIVKFRLATVKESSGALQEALALYSELIVAQTEHVSLDVVIFRAALLLKHIGSTAQAMEYFEFLTDEPPVEGGYTKLHLLSLLGLVYEESSDKYSLVMKEIFTQVIPLYVAEITKMGNTGEKRSFSPDRKQRPSADVRLTRSIDEPRYNNSDDTLGTVPPDASNLLLTLTPKTMTTSSELWEMLGLQAIHACDYLMAAEMLAKAVSVSIVKRRLLHATAEVYYMLGQTTRALPLAEKCLSMQPHSAVLRNFVLVLDPEKYAERLREMTLSDATKPKTSILKGSKDMNKEKKLINADKEQISRLIKALDSDEEWDAVGGYNPNLSIDGMITEGNEAAAATADDGDVGVSSSTAVAKAKVPMGSPTPQSQPPSSSDSPGWLAKVATRTAAALKGGAETSKTLFSAIATGTLNGGGVSIGAEESLETRANRQGRKDLAGVLEQQQQRRSQSPNKVPAKGKDVIAKGIAGGGAGPPRPLSPPLSPPLHPLLMGKTKLNPLGSDHITGKPDNVGSKPEKPKVSKETRNMVHNLLSGNQNVHYYDPNLRFLAEQKAKASFDQYKTV